MIERANTFISNHFVELVTMANDEILALEKDSFGFLLSRSDRFSKHREGLNTIKIWIKNDKRNRSNFAYKLLQKVRFSLVDSKDLDIIAQYPNRYYRNFY